jgi:hypothetical protein
MVLFASEGEQLAFPAKTTMTFQCQKHQKVVVVAQSVLSTSQPNTVPMLAHRLSGWQRASHDSNQQP